MRLLHRYLCNLTPALFFSIPLYAAPEPPKLPIVFVETVKTAELSDRLMYPARLVSKVNATVLAEADGIVKIVLSPLGKSVRKSEKMIVMANTDPIYQYAPLAVTSPVAGVVSTVDVTEGSRVNRGQKLATVTDPKQIRLQVEVPLSDLPALQTGMVGELTISSQPAPIAVKISGISPFVDPGTGTASAELAFVDVKKTTMLIPGLVGRVSLKAKQHVGIEIPEHAVIYKGRNPHVRMIENGIAKLKSVAIGETRRGAVEILSGINAGETLVVRANGYVADGEKVEVQKSESASGGG